MRYKIFDRVEKLETKKYATIEVEGNGVKTKEELVKKVLGTLKKGEWIVMDFKEETK